MARIPKNLFIGDVINEEKVKKLSTNDFLFTLQHEIQEYESLTKKGKSLYLASNHLKNISILMNEYYEKLNFSNKDKVVGYVCAIPMEEHTIDSLKEVYKYKMPRFNTLETKIKNVNTIDQFREICKSDDFQFAKQCVEYLNKNAYYQGNYINKLISVVKSNVDTPAEKRTIQSLADYNPPKTKKDWKRQIDSDLNELLAQLDNLEKNNVHEFKRTERTSLNDNYKDPKWQYTYSLEKIKEILNRPSFSNKSWQNPSWMKKLQGKANKIISKKYIHPLIVNDLLEMGIRLYGHLEITESKKYQPVTKDNPLTKEEFAKVKSNERRELNEKIDKIEKSKNQLHNEILENSGLGRDKQKEINTKLLLEIENNKQDKLLNDRVNNFDK